MQGCMPPHEDRDGLLGRASHMQWLPSKLEVPSFPIPIPMRRNTARRNHKDPKTALACRAGRLTCSDCPGSSKCHRSRSRSRSRCDEIPPVATPKTRRPRWLAGPGVSHAMVASKLEVPSFPIPIPMRRNTARRNHKDPKTALACRAGRLTCSDCPGSSKCHRSRSRSRSRDDRTPPVATTKTRRPRWSVGACFQPPFSHHPGLLAYHEVHDRSGSAWPTLQCDALRHLGVLRVFAFSACTPVQIAATWRPRSNRHPAPPRDAMDPWNPWNPWNPCPILRWTVEVDVPPT
jgi:hypothetical protein